MVRRTKAGFVPAGVNCCSMVFRKCAFEGRFNFPSVAVNSSPAERTCLRLLKAHIQEK